MHQNQKYVPSAFKIPGQIPIPESTNINWETPHSNFNQNEYNNSYIFSVDLCKDVSCIDPYVKHVKGILAPDVKLDTPERKWYVLPSRLFPTAGNASLVLLCSCKTYFKTIPFKIQTSKKTDSFISDKKRKERHSKFWFIHF